MADRCLCVIAVARPVRRRDGMHAAPPSVVGLAWYAFPMIGSTSDKTAFWIPVLAMRRREFMRLASGLAVWPVAAEAQQAKPTPRVGVLVGLAQSEETPVAQAFIGPFRESMRSAGWIEGNNIHIDYRFGGSLANLVDTKASAAELIALKPDVIYSQGLPATLTLRQLTSTIPIVFTQLIDPVGYGLAESLSHPGGNVTGFVVWEFAIAGKWVQQLQELIPDLAEVGILFNPDTAPYAQGLISAAREADRGLQIVECRTHDDAEIEDVLGGFAGKPRRALIVVPEPFTYGHRDHIVAACVHLGLPSLNAVLGAVNIGALISYTFVFDELIRAPVDYISRILKGAAPRDLPIQAPKRDALVINLRAAKALNLEIPPGLLARADEVIE